MSQRTFPVLKGYKHRKHSDPSEPPHIPWATAERAYVSYAAKYGTSQSLEQLASRGGFSSEELDVLAPGWRSEVSPAAPVPGMDKPPGGCAVLLIDSETNYGVGTVPVEYLSPEQQAGLYREKRDGAEWWCVRVPSQRTPSPAVDWATAQLIQDLRAGRELRWTVGAFGHLSEWTFTEAFRLWLADYLEAGNRIPEWLTGEEKVSPAVLSRFTR